MQFGTEMCAVKRSKFKVMVDWNRGGLDPEFYYLAGSGSMLDPDMSAPAGYVGSSRIDSDPNRMLITWIRPDPYPNLTTGENYSFCTTTGRNWNDCLPVFVTELQLE